jgi:lysozyme family protein
MKKFFLAIFLTLVAFSGSALAQCSARCETAFKFVVSHEDRNLTGVIALEPQGGYARFGVNSRAHPEMIKLGFYSYKMGRTRALHYAENLFYKGYWKYIKGDDIQDKRLAFRMADLAYNLGPVRATILLQRALNQQGAMLFDRGYFGDDTLFWANQMQPERTVFLVKNQARGFYKRLAERYPVMRTWKGVWLDRLAEPEMASVFMPDWLSTLVNPAHELPILAKGE